MVEKKHGFQIFAHVIMIFIAFCSVAPFILLLSSSFTDDAALSVYGYSFFPPKFSTDAYDYLFTSSSAIFNALRNHLQPDPDDPVCLSAFQKRFARPVFLRVLPVFYHAVQRRLGALLHHVDPDLPYPQHSLCPADSQPVDERLQRHYDAHLFYLQYSRCRNRGGEN